MQRAIPMTIMRGGTSKGLYFAASDLPSEQAARDAVLLAAMGSPDPRQIDGLGGAHPLTSKAAILSRSSSPGADVDYLFLQVSVDKPEVSASQTCGNILAGVGPCAIETGLVTAKDGVTPVRIALLNTGGVAVAHVPTPGKRVTYEGDARIDGAPGAAAAIMLDFLDVAGSSCGALLPTGNVVDDIDGVSATCIDNGMPVVILDARELQKTGYEAPDALEADAALKRRLEQIRLAIGPRMNLGDVAAKTVPKMCLAAPARNGGLISTRTFIPHRVHDAIGVLGAISVATACLIPGSVAHAISRAPAASGPVRLDVEHPSGFLTVEIDVEATNGDIVVRRSALMRTARLLAMGDVYVPESAWSAA